MGKRSDPAHGWQQRQNALQRKRVRAERAMVVSGADKQIFTYAAMDAETRIVVLQRASEIKTLGRKVADDIFEMGAKFADVRDRLRHNKAGGFEGWIEHEGFKRRFVYNVICVYEAFANRANFAQLDVQVSALYLLVAPSTTDEARQMLIQRAEAGETITYTAAKRAIDQHKPAAPPHAPIQPMDDAVWEGLANADPAPAAEESNPAFTPFASPRRAKETETAVPSLPGILVGQRVQHGNAAWSVIGVTSSQVTLRSPNGKHITVNVKPIIDVMEMTVMPSPMMPANTPPAATNGKSHTLSVLTSSDSVGQRVQHGNAAWGVIGVTSSQVTLRSPNGKHITVNVKPIIDVMEMTVMPPPMMPSNTPPAAPLRVIAPPPGRNHPASTNGKSHTLSVLTSSDSNEWYTPARYVDAARVLMGGIDLDPASCALANETVGAARIFALEDDGLAQEWRGRVWINPPYGKEDGESNQARWSAKLISEWCAGRIDHAVMLVNASTGSKWFQALWQYPICFTDHRIEFNNAAGAASQPTQSNAFVYFGDALERFIDVFSAFGVIVPNAIRRSASR